MKMTCTLHAIFGIVGGACFFLATFGTFIHYLISQKKVPSEIKDFQKVAQNVRYQTNLFYLFLGIVLYFISFITGILQGINISGGLGHFFLKIIFTVLVLIFLIGGGGLNLYLNSKNNLYKEKFLKLFIIIGFFLILLNLTVINYIGSSSHKFLF